MRSLVGMEFNNSPVPQPTVSFSEEERGFTPFVPEWRNMLDEDNLAASSVGEKHGGKFS